MWDLLYIAVMIALVVVAAAFVIGCDRIIGPDHEALAEQGQDEADLELADQVKAAA